MSIDKHMLVFEIAAARFYAAAAGQVPANLSTHPSEMRKENERVAEYLMSVEGAADLTLDALAQEVSKGFLGEVPSAYEQVDTVDVHHWDLAWEEIERTGLNTVIANRLLSTTILRGERA